MRNKLFVIVISVSILLLTSGCSTPQKENSINIVSTFPRISVDTNDEIHIAWIDSRDEPDMNGGIYYTKLNNNGKPVINQTRINNPKSCGTCPRIITDYNNDCYITWEESWESGNDRHLFYEKIDNKNNSVIDDKILIKKEKYIPNTVDLFVDVKNNLHIVYEYGTSGDLKVFYSKLNQRGETIIKTKVLTEKVDVSHNPKIISNKDNDLFIIFHADPIDQDPFNPYNRIYLMKINEAGEINIPPTIISIYKDNNEDWYPDLTLDPNQNLHVIWMDRNSNIIFYEKLANNGSIIVNEKQVVTWGKNIFYPNVVSDSKGNIHVIFQDTRYINNQEQNLFYKRLDNNGNTLINDTQINPFKPYVHAPDMAIDSEDNIHIVFVGEYEIYYMKLDDSGNILVNKTQITPLGNKKTISKEIQPIYVISMLLVATVVTVVIIIYIYIKLSKRNKESKKLKFKQVS